MPVCNNFGLDGIKLKIKNCLEKLKCGMLFFLTFCIMQTFPEGLICAKYWYAGVDIQILEDTAITI